MLRKVLEMVLGLELFTELIKEIKLLKYKFDTCLDITAIKLSGCTTSSKNKLEFE